MPARMIIDIFRYLTQQRYELDIVEWRLIAINKHNERLQSLLAIP